MSQLSERLGAALADRYTVERELGQGGMATVFLAHDRKHERRVAIKVMGRDLAAQLGADRFLREIKTVAQLTHPNILPLYDSGDAGGLLYYVMPFVEGGSLRDRLDREGALPLEDALEIAQEVADALSHAHAHGFIHRDIKPENILFAAGRPVVADFGIARAVSAASGENLTQTGMAVGTPAYMSPEQAAGDPQLDGRSDVYALGCVLYEMLAGRPPFTGRNAMEVLARHTMEAAVSLRTSRPTIPVNVDETVARALAKIPADRFATARDFARAIAGRLAAAPKGPGALLAGLLSGTVLALVTGYALLTVLAWAAARWAVNRFALSPHIPAFVLVALVLLLPGVVAVAYVVGNRGTRWRAAHTAGVSANLAAAVAALVLLFGGKDLGAATTSVTLTDEEGRSVERVIPKAEFRKRIGLFYLDADPADSVARELAYAIPEALSVDLYQDLYIDVRTPPYFRDRLRAAGLRDLTGVSLGLAREIATEQFRDQFVMGTVKTEGPDLIVALTVYRTATGEKVEEVMVRDRDPLVLTDQLATALRGTVEIPEGYAGAALDLPVAELLTKSPAAFGHFARALRVLTVDNDFPRAAASLEDAIAADSTFAFANYQLFVVYVYQNRGQEGLRPLQAAVDRVYRLPERMRNQVKANYYEMRQEPEKMYAVIQMNAELFPGDVQALAALVQVQMLRGQRREAIETTRRILEADPNQHDYLRALAEMHQGLGEYDEALECYAEYRRLNPNDRRGLIGIGDVQQALGRFDAAREAYEQVSLLDPGNVEAALRIADLEATTGQFDRALATYEATLESARSSTDSASVLDDLAGYYFRRGRIAEGIRLRERAWAEEAKTAPPIQIIIQRLQGVGDHIAAGDTARALEILAEYGRQLQPPFDDFAPLGDLDVALELEDPATIDRVAAQIERVVATSSFGFLRSAASYARGQAHYLRGEYREAITTWEQERELNPRDATIPRQLGQAYRGLGDFGRAGREMEESRRLLPGDPRTRYEMALLEEARGRPERAVEHLRAALEVWADADPSYKWARRAREKLAQLQGSR